MQINPPISIDHFFKRLLSAIHKGLPVQREIKHPPTPKRSTPTHSTKRHFTITLKHPEEDASLEYHRPPSAATWAQSDGFRFS